MISPAILQDDLIDQIVLELDNRSGTEIRQRCYEYKTEIGAVLDVPSTREQERWLLRAKEACLKAAKALTAAGEPQEIDWTKGPIKLGHFSGRLSELAATLFVVSQLASDAAKNLPPSPPNAHRVPHKDLCALYAFRLMEEFSKERPKKSPNSKYFTIAGLLYEFVISKGQGAEESVERSCRKVLEEFPQSDSTWLIPRFDNDGPPLALAEFIEEQWTHLSTSQRVQHNKRRQSLGLMALPMTDDEIAHFEKS
jgi:hypothetical protein